VSDDEGLKEILDALVREMPKQAGPNGAQFAWFFRRLGQWTSEDWFELAAAIAAPGLAKQAGAAFEAAQTEAMSAGTAHAIIDWGGPAWNAGKMFFPLHSKEMNRGVGMVVERMSPRPAMTEVSGVMGAGVDALRTAVMTAAIGLATRPIIRPELFSAMWEAFEPSLGLLVSERGAAEHRT
jgi:hypothetical protein